MKGERGSASLEFLIIVFILVFPAMGLLSVITWPERVNAARAAAYEAAKAVVEADDPVAGQDVGRERALEVIANHGYDTSDVEVVYSLADPDRGEALEATVTVSLPALTFPGIGAWESIRHSVSSTQRVPDYRGFE